MKMTAVLKGLQDIFYISTESMKEIDPKLESFVNVNSLEDLAKLLRG